MRIYKLSLFNKFAIVAILVVMAFGITNLYFLWNSGYKSFEREIDKRSKVLSSIIADRVLQPVVYDDYVNVYKVIDQIHSNDSSVAYIFILDDNNKIIAQTYETPIPYSLIEANQIMDGKLNIKVIHTRNFTHKVIRDIAYPILNGEIGTVRLGLIEEDIRKELNSASRTLSLMVISFLIIGLIGSFFFSFLITLPIKKITQKAQNLDLSSLEIEEFENKPLRLRTIYKYYFSDELDILVAKFSEMIDRLKQNIRELQAARNSFVQAEKLASIGTLTAGISHEINNPLAGIKNCMSRIEKEPGNVEQNIRYIELIKDAVEKMEGVVKPLLTFSRKTEFRIEQVAMDELVEHALSLTDYRIRKSGIHIQKNMQPELRISVSANHMEQVLINLILNGIDAIEERKQKEPGLQGILRFSSSNEGQKTRIIVSDNGSGIPGEYQNKIFDPFFTSKEQGKGTGLGLYVSYNIINDMGGHMYFETIAGEGTRFIIEFPKSTNNHS